MLYFYCLVRRTSYIECLILNTSMVFYGCRFIKGSIHFWKKNCLQLLNHIISSRAFPFILIFFMLINFHITPVLKTGFQLFSQYFMGILFSGHRHYFFVLLKCSFWVSEDTIGIEFKSCCGIKSQNFLWLQLQLRFRQKIQSLNNSGSIYFSYPYVILLNALPYP